VILRNCLTVVGSFWISWFGIFIIAFITVLGKNVPVEVSILRL
jgi:hypothetical protein